MRKEWFEFVHKIRVKTERRTKKKCSHREAMKIASPLWVKEKAKIIRKRAKLAKQEKKNQNEKTVTDSTSKEDENF